MNKTIKEDKKSGTVTLKVILSDRRTADDPVVNFLTNDARRLLSEEGYAVSGCRKKDSITNHRETDSHEGEWIFDVVNIALNKEKQSLTKGMSHDKMGDKKTNSPSQRKGK